MNTQGILTMAIGHPYFGKLAYNLSLSIKAVANIPIALIYDDKGLSHLNHNQKKIFDYLIDKPIEGNGLIAANQLRMMLPKLTPFKETISIDADMLWLSKTPLDLFNLLSDRDITMINEGYVNLDTWENHTNKKYMFWADPKIIKEAYNLTGKLYQTRGEFIVFRKTKEVQQLYATAKKIQAKPLIATRKLAGSITDEFALNIAANLCGMEPHENQWQPAYWYVMYGNLIPAIHQLHKNYYAISAGGNKLNINLQKTYESIMNAVCYKHGLRNVFNLQAKKSHLTERNDA